MASMGMPRFSESKYDGVGFGLGFSIMLDPAKARRSSAPPANMPGAAPPAPRSGSIRPKTWPSFCFTQLTPSSTYPIRRELRVLTYAAIDN